MQMQSQNNSTSPQAQPRKLVLKKETLRRLTTNELKLVGGRNPAMTGYGCSAPAA